MAESSVAITAGSGTPVAVFVDPSGFDRQVMVLGDSVAANVVKVGVSGGLSVKGASPTGQTLNVTAATPVTGTGLDASEAGNVTFVIKNTVAATAFTGVPVIVFEQSDDNVQWAPLQVTSTSGSVASSPAIATGAANTSQMFDGGVEGVNWVRVRVTTAQTANGMTVITQLGGLAFSPSVGLPGVTTKGIQGPVGTTTQDLKDGGRTSIMLTASVASTAVAETLITLTKSAGLAATTTGSSLAITTGKKFRIQTITASVRNSSGTTPTSNVTMNLRAAVAGATTTASPLQAHWMINIPASAASTLFPDAHIPDGFEIDSNAGTNTYGVTITHPQWVTGTTTATFDITIIGFEY